MEMYWIYILYSQMDIQIGILRKTPVSNYIDENLGSNFMTYWWCFFDIVHFWKVAVTIFLSKCLVSTETFPKQKHLFFKWGINSYWWKAFLMGNPVYSCIFQWSLKLLFYKCSIFDVLLVSSLKYRVLRFFLYKLWTSRLWTMQ